MKQTEIRNLRNDFYRFYRQAANLNLYLQNARKPDVLRIAAEIKRLSDKLEELSNTPPLKNGRFFALKYSALTRLKSGNRAKAIL